MLNLIKKISQLNTRQRVYISLFVLLVLFLLIQRVDLSSLLNAQNSNFEFTEPLILAVATYFSMLWISEFRVSGERFITIAGFPAVGVFVFALFVELIITTIFGQLGVLTFNIISGAVFLFFTYILMLTANIVNVAYLEDIPLGQAGRAAYYVMNLIISYLLFLIVISNELNIIAKSIMVFIIPYFAVTSTLWTVKLKFSQRMLVALCVSFLIAFAFIVLSIWPLVSIYLSFILSVILYITLGVALEVREIITRQIWIEYIVLFILVFSIVLVLSEWGINGSIVL